MILGYSKRQLVAMAARIKKFLRWDFWRLFTVVSSGHPTLHWRHNDHDDVSNHQPHGCLLNRLFRRRSKKTTKLRVTGLCMGTSPGPVNSPHKGPVTRKMFPFDDVIMKQLSWKFQLSTFFLGWHDFWANAPRLKCLHCRLLVRNIFIWT